MFCKQSKYDIKQVEACLTNTDFRNLRVIQFMQPVWLNDSKELKLNLNASLDVR